MVINFFDSLLKNYPIIVVSLKNIVNTKFSLNLNYFPTKTATTLHYSKFFLLSLLKLYIFGRKINLILFTKKIIIRKQTFFTIFCKFILNFPLLKNVYFIMRAPTTLVYRLLRAYLFGSLFDFDTLYFINDHSLWYYKEEQDLWYYETPAWRSKFYKIHYFYVSLYNDYELELLEYLWNYLKGENRLFLKKKLIAFNKRHNVFYHFFKKKLKNPYTDLFTQKKIYVKKVAKPNVRFEFFIRQHDYFDYDISNFDRLRDVGESLVQKYATSTKIYKTYTNDFYGEYTYTDRDFLGLAHVDFSSFVFFLNIYMRRKNLKYPKTTLYQINTTRPLLARVRPYELQNRLLKKKKLTRICTSYNALPWKKFYPSFVLIALDYICYDNYFYDSIIISNFIDICVNSTVYFLHGKLFFFSYYYYFIIIYKYRLFRSSLNLAFNKSHKFIMNKKSKIRLARYHMLKKKRKSQRYKQNYFFFKKIKKNKVINKVYKSKRDDNLKIIYKNTGLLPHFMGSFIFSFFKKYKNLLHNCRCSNYTFRIQFFMNIFKKPFSFSMFYFLLFVPNIIGAKLFRKFTSKYTKKTINRVDNLYKMQQRRHAFYSITNFIPFIFLKSTAKRYILKSLKKRKKFRRTIFYQRYLVGALEHSFNTKVFIKLFSLSQYFRILARHRFVQYLCSKYYFYQIKVGRGFFLRECIYVVFTSLLFHDPFFFLNWFVKTMRRIQYKKHKVLIYFLRKLFLKSLSTDKIKRFLKIRGFFFDIRGKVGVTGNAKKRHVAFSHGHTSFTSKMQSLRYEHGLIRTRTGVLGVTFGISY